jgi:hypothetical protein
MTLTAPEGASAKRHLLIVSRHHPGLYDYMRQRFAAEPNVAVIFDRRRGRDRRSHGGNTEMERRGGERRLRPQVDAALKMESMQFLTILPEPIARRGEGRP